MEVSSPAATGTVLLSLAETPPVEEAEGLAPPEAFPPAPWVVMPKSGATCSLDGLFVDEFDAGLADEARGGGLGKVDICAGLGQGSNIHTPSAPIQKPFLMLN